MAGEFDLMRRYVEDEPGAFPAFYRATYERLGCYLRTFVRRSPEDARDLLQEVYTKVHRKRHTFQLAQSHYCDRGAMKWLLTVARNVALDHVRKKARNPTTISPGWGQLDEVDETLWATRPETPFDILAERHRTRRLKLSVHRAVDCLSSSQREAIRMTSLGDLNSNGLSELTGATPTAVRVRCSRGYKALRSNPDLQQLAGSAL